MSETTKNTTVTDELGQARWEAFWEANYPDGYGSNSTRSRSRTARRAATISRLAIVIEAPVEATEAIPATPLEDAYLSTDERLAFHGIAQQLTSPKPSVQ